MFRGKCLSIVLLLSITSASWGASSDTSVGIEHGRTSGSALSTIGSGAFSLLELAAHATIFVGSGDHALNSPFAKMLSYIPESVYDFTATTVISNRVAHSVFLSQLLRLLPVANDYVCGMMTLTTEDGYYIDSVLINQGSIQNDSQFEHIGDNLYVPKSRGITNLLLVKQMSGWSTAGSAYITENPIDLFVTVSDGRQTSTINVQKSSCTLYSYGKAHASVIKGDDVSFCLTNSGTDSKVSTITTLTSAYGKPALMRIPGEACESY
ncbi:hypothetical protein [Endozoicomonas sp. SCSIO W0465]|uniref:hypothetical protein n=1 Tax=Endozoicomonas sp. SCSIO W0465 TaxID=2918516 RepID=UPI0020754718|nr:hypothetical protein [Endozoicomonas sp. SCSIO W0465]USE37860.1 hypothetical protein MJO57_06605 [Endozoicomonas sp. SCSIO W0465]